MEEVRAKVETATVEVRAEMRVKPAVEEVRAEVETFAEEVLARVEMATEEVRAEIRVGTDGRVRQNEDKSKSPYGDPNSEIVRFPELIFSGEN